MALFDVTVTISNVMDASEDLRLSATRLGAAS
jgi:hypothetical protein